MKRLYFYMGVVSFCLLNALFLLEGPLRVHPNTDLVRAGERQGPLVLHHGTLQHEYFPIVLRGSDVPQLRGLWDNNIRVTFYDGEWYLESFQIDEKDPSQSDLIEQGGYVATEPGHPHYIEDTSDQTNHLGEDDELVFYARQGAKVPEKNWWNSIYPNRIEIEIHEPPGAGNGTAWMYIYYDIDDHGRWREDPTYYDYITWSGKTNDWYTGKTDWYCSSRQDSNPGLQDLLRITSSGKETGVDLLEEGLKKYSEAFAELPWPLGDVQAQVREGHWNGTYYDDIVDNVGYDGSRTQQSSADGVACIDGPVRVIYFTKHYYRYTLLGLPTVELEVNVWFAVYLMGSSSGPILMTNQIAPVKYIKQITTTSFAHVEGMKFVDEAGRLGIIDGNPLSDDFTSYLNAPTHWGFYYGSSGSIWIAIPYDSFATHGCEVNLYWRDTGEWHRGEAGQYTKIIPGNSTWWTAPIWTFIGEVILSDSLARTKATEYHTLYENKLQTGNFFQIARNSQLLEPSKENETFPLPSSPYTGKIPKWAPLMVLVVLTGLGFLWKRIKSS